MKHVIAAVLALIWVSPVLAESVTPPECPRQGPLFVIRQADFPIGNPEQYRAALRRFIAAAGTPYALVILDPNLDIDFSSLPSIENGVPNFPVQLARCVRLTSIARLDALRDVDVAAPPAETVVRDPPPAQPRKRHTRVGAEANLPSATATDPKPERVPAPPNTLQWNASWADRLIEARSASSLGPVLRYGPSRSDHHGPFLNVNCRWEARDNVRISGFRLFGPSFEQQSTSERGIQIYRCFNVEVSNMEIAGWGFAGVDVEDQQGEDRLSYFEPLEPKGTKVEVWGRIRAFRDVRVFNSYIHHNQHPEDDGAAGYGVVIGPGAWAHFYENVFDSNRHAVSAGSHSGGYIADRNLVLKGGGYHGLWYTHQFDMHGTGCWWNDDLCGDAAVEFHIRDNSFQYVNGSAIELRGKPERGALITGNVFAHERLKNVYGFKFAYDVAINPAISLNTEEHVLEENNVTDSDSFGDFGVCDFDGDGIDDLFQATGATWWYSSLGEYQWAFLSMRREKRADLRFGYFDNDARCDVLISANGRWLISSGGRGDWTDIGATDGASLDATVFGRFDLDHRSQIPGETRRTTDAFWRTESGDWMVKPLYSGQQWRRVGHSDLPFSAYAFADFTNDGITDVLAVVGGRWQISEGAAGPWRPLNDLSESVDQLRFADLDNNNRDDVLRFDGAWKQAYKDGPWLGNFTWWVSDDGISPWRKLTSYSWSTKSVPRTPPAFAGRFGVAPGGGVLVVDFDRFGQFYAPGETARGALPKWHSQFRY